MGRPGAGAPGLTSVAPPVFESSVASPPGTPRAGQVLVQAILEETDHLPDTGPVGRALQSVRQLRWEAVHGWWVWRVPGQREQLHLVLGTGARYATGCGIRSVTPLWRHWNGDDQPPLGARGGGM